MKDDFYLRYCKACPHLHRELTSGKYYCGVVKLRIDRELEPLSFGNTDDEHNGIRHYQHGHIEDWYRRMCFNKSRHSFARTFEKGRHSFARTFEKGCVHSDQLKLILKLEKL